MTVTGFFQKMNEQGEIKTSKNVRFESTGIKDNGKVIWRKLNKDGTPSIFLPSSLNLMYRGRMANGLLKLIQRLCFVNIHN